MKKNEDLIETIDRNISLFDNLFHSGIKNKITRLVRFPLQIISRAILLRIHRGFIFLIKTKTFFGYPITIHSFEYCLWITGCLGGTEIGLQKYLIKSLPSEGVFFDVGAHHGFYSLLAHFLTDEHKTQIHTFEPTDVHYALTEMNVRPYKNIHASKYAICERSGTRTFYMTMGAGSTIEKDFFKDVASVDLSEFKTIEVSCTTLDEYCVKNSVLPTFIKIDVEGSENEVLKGGIETIKRGYPTIAMEIWSKPHNNKNHIEAVQILMDLGYQMYKIENDGELKLINFTELMVLLDIPHSSDNYLFKREGR